MCYSRVLRSEADPVSKQRKRETKDREKPSWDEAVSVVLSSMTQRMRTLRRKRQVRVYRQAGKGICRIHLIETEGTKKCLNDAVEDCME